MSIFSIGVTGLNSARMALNTTSNNISNVFTPGYNRELTLLAENTVGGGSKVTDIQRQFDHFVASQLNRANSSFSSLKNYQTQVSQIDNLLADTDAGLAPIMQDFFAALQDMAAAPSDPAARQGVIGKADSLTSQFRSLGRYLNDMQDGIGTQIESEVAQINNTVELIAELNHEISIARAKSGEAPNTLLNQRDQLVADLSQHIDADLHIQGANYNITVGNGQPLVAGTQAYRLVAMQSAADPFRTVVGYMDSAGNRMELAENTFTGGKLGGLMAYRSETLDVVQNKVGQLAISLAMGFNEQHRQGVDLNGDAGGAFFSVAAPQSYSDANNSGSSWLTAELTDHTAITGTDYRLEVIDAATGEFQVSPSNGGAAFTVTADAGSQLNFDGMTVTLHDTANLHDGDRFHVQPTRAGADKINNLIHDTAKLAAGMSSESGDNRNALAMQSLQDEHLVGGNASLNQAYAAIVGEVGNRTNIVQVNLAAQQSLTEQIRMVQQSESGVNLDEEYTNLIRYQQFYAANAKVIETGATIIDTLLGLRG